MTASKVVPVLGPVGTVVISIVAIAVAWGVITERVKRLDVQLDRLESINRDHVRDHAAITGALADHGARLLWLERDRNGERKK